MFSQQTRVSIINPDFDFNKLGIGGLDTEFNAIFRRAFASRVFPQEIIEQLGKIKLDSLNFSIYLKFFFKIRMQTRQRDFAVWSAWYW